LAPDSELRYPDTFADSARHVMLRGQAFFEVDPEGARPFRIHARNTTTEVLGTAFSIQAYPETAALRVVVAEGRVSVTDDRSRNSATVSRGEIATVTQGQVTTAFAQDLDAELAWRDGQLPFRQTPLPEVLRTLERWYAVDMTLADSTLSQRRLTAEFDGESLSEALEVLRLSLDVPIQQSDSSVVIAPSDELPPRR
jgi:ferric-dicitrate binding protein FerR (iron transport regulator)